MISTKKTLVMMFFRITETSNIRIAYKTMSAHGYYLYYMKSSTTFWRFTIVITLCLISTYLVIILQPTHPELVLTEVLGKDYSGIILDENNSGNVANFTLEHCGCHRFLKGIVIPFVEFQAQDNNS